MAYAVQILIHIYAHRTECHEWGAALRHALPVAAANLLALCLCLLFVLMGNYLSTVKLNYFVGVRTPWTLESARVWAKTHRLAGKLFFWGGLLAAALVAVPAKMGFWVVMA